MMKGIGLGCLLVASALLTVTVAAAAETMPLRSFSRFELDTGTANGLWAEIGSSYSDDGALGPGSSVTNREGLSFDTVNVFGRAAYGCPYGEAGLILPYNDVDVDIEGLGSDDENGIGDIRLYGKAVPIRTELIDLGAGFDFSFPSGDEDDGLGDGEVGFLPFFTAAVHLGTVDARGHFGYRFFTDKDKWESFVYGFGLYGPVNDKVALRAEFNSVTQKAHGPDIDPWTFEPGVDIRIPAGDEMSVLVRPTVLVGMNDDAPDWGIGGSVALAWSPR